MSPERISVIGLGKLGACVAACLAARGKTVIGVDLSAQVVAAVNSGCPPIQEPGLDEQMAAAAGRFAATQDIEAAVLATDISLILVPTPSEPDGSYALGPCLEAAQGIGRALRRKTDYHLVVLTSTVLPGETESQVVPAIEAASGRRLGDDFGACYSPEFVALGTVIQDFLNPDLLLIGESDGRAGDKLVEMYRSTCENEPPVARMSIVNAELAKLAVNTFVTMKISFANMLAGICERLPGGDVDAVTGALGLDRRIGAKYLKGALGYGGPCFPRDNLALGALARRLDYPTTLPEATDAYNQAHMDLLVGRVIAMLPAPGATVAIFGMSYKPGTPVTEESPGVLLAQGLAARGAAVVVHDPLVQHSGRPLGDRIVAAGSIGEALADAQVAVLAHPDPGYAAMIWQQLRPDQLVLDPWRLLRGRARDARRYVGGGLGRPTDAWALDEFVLDPASEVRG